MTERMGLAAVGRQNGQRAALARRAELRPAARRLAAVAVGFAGGWAVVYGALMPFGLGFVLGFAEDCFAPCAAGAALGVLLHGFGALSLRSVCMLCALGAAVAARWMGARTLTPAALAGCGTLVGVALCFAFGGGGAELVFYSAADALLAAAMGFCLRQFAPEKPGAGMLLVGAAAAAALGSVQLWQLLLRDLMMCKLQLYDRIYNIDLLDELKSQSSGWQLSALKQALVIVQEAYDALVSSVGMKTALETMALKIDKIYKE